MQKVELLKQIASNPHIPSPPMVILRVLEQASKPDCTIPDLCQIIQMDPGLGGNVLRIVNSALFGLSRPASSIQRALAIVGLSSARLLLLATSLPKVQKSLKVDPMLNQRYWRSSIAGAIVARALSQRLGSREPEDDMASGLLRDIGELILQQLFPEDYGKVFVEAADGLINEQCRLEESCCGLDHAEVSAYVLNRWRLPADITEAVRHHHHPEQGTFSTPLAEDRAYHLLFATRAAQLLLYPGQPLVLQELMELAQGRFKMDETALKEFLMPLGPKIAEFAAVMQVDIGGNTDYQAILVRASEELVTLALSANVDNQRALDTIRRAESEVRHWKNEAAYDPLTKVFNRRYLEARLGELFDRSLNSDPNFGLLFIDLDGFKLLNDRCGHLFGDFVLQQVADCLNRQVRQGDMVSRYGGDEFCVLFDPVDQLGIQSLADRVWQKINELTIRQAPHEGKVGASIGVVHCQSSSNWGSPDVFLATADKAMYLAKTRGKNRVVFMGSLLDADDVNPSSKLACSSRVDCSSSRVSVN